MSRPAGREGESEKNDPGRRLKASGKTLARFLSAPSSLPRLHLRDASFVLGSGGQFKSAVALFGSLDVGSFQIKELQNLAAGAHSRSRHLCCMRTRSILALRWLAL